MPTSLTQKLQLKAGKLIVLNAPKGYAEQLSKELNNVTVTTRAGGQAEAVLLFVNTLAEVVERAPKAIQAVKPDGLLWVAYAKSTSKVKTGVNRDRLWEAMEPTGWRPVRQIAIDEVWSALRFRPAEQVGK